MTTSIKRIVFVAVIVVIVGLLAADVLNASADEQGPLLVRIAHGWGHMANGSGRMMGWGGMGNVWGRSQCRGNALMGRRPWGGNNGQPATGQ